MKQVSKMSTQKHTDTYIVCKHQCSGLNDKLMRFLILDDGSSQACCCAGFAAGVHSSRTKLLHLPSTSTPASAMNYSSDIRGNVPSIIYS